MLPVALYSAWSSGRRDGCAERPASEQSVLVFSVAFSVLVLVCNAPDHLSHPINPTTRRIAGSSRRLWTWSRRQR
eukprot:3469366-Rhodomonas_salina.1